MTRKAPTPKKSVGRFFVSHVGRKFGRLTVLTQWRVTPHTYCECACDCGKRWVGRSYNLTRGSTKSCGCVLSEGAAHRLRKIRFRHGLTDTPEHRSWCALRNRCMNPTNDAYADYGGRGIYVAPEWDDFAAFLRDMGPSPGAGYSIDRIDNDGPYTKANCRWATKAVQIRNRRNNILLTHDGETMCATDWAARVGLKRATLAARIKAGWPANDILTKPARYIRKHG